jgi:hypothetical protein
MPGYRGKLETLLDDFVRDRIRPRARSTGTLSALFTRYFHKETENMYEDMQFVKIGDADSVILGMNFFGVDPDGSDFPPHFEFETDGEDTNIAE